jgi:hypothetical protein
MIWLCLVLVLFGYVLELVSSQQTLLRVDLSLRAPDHGASSPENQNNNTTTQQQDNTTTRQQKQTKG